MAFIWDFFRPLLAERRGTELASASLAIGTGGHAVTASATVSIVMPLPRRKVTIKSINLVGSVAATGSGAITVQVQKYVSGATAITAATSLTSSFITATGTFNVALTNTTDGQRLIDGTAGNYLRVDLVAAGTVTLQPTAVLVVEYGFCE